MDRREFLAAAASLTTTPLLAFDGEKQQEEKYISLRRKKYRGYRERICQDQLAEKEILRVCEPASMIIKDVLDRAKSDHFGWAWVPPGAPTTSYMDKNIQERYLYWCVSAAVYGDYFLIIERNASGRAIGVYGECVDNMYRVETTSRELVEFQRSEDGPDYKILSKCDPGVYHTECKVKRYKPEEVVHIRPGGRYYPTSEDEKEVVSSVYGTSLLDLMPLDYRTKHWFVQRMMDGVMEAHQRYVS